MLGAPNRAYFDKPASALSLGEAALLAGMVRGRGSYYDLAKRPGKAEGRRWPVLRAHGRCRCRSARAGEEDAEAGPVILQQRAPAFGAPHFVRALLAGDLGVSPDAAGGTVTTTLDVDLQRAAELATQHVIGSLGDKHVTAASVVVLDNATGDILAYVGSPDFFDEGRAGQNDGALARRQPGSTLKPFVYELAMERLGMTPASVLPDIELHLPTPTGDFSPRDYDEAFHGPVRMREALGNSLNVPAVFGRRSALESRAPSSSDFACSGCRSTGPPSSMAPPSLSVMARSRCSSSRVRMQRSRVAGRSARPARSSGSTSRANGRRPSQPTRRASCPTLAAMRVTDMLKDRKARVATFGEGSVLEFSFEAAGKTGTSKGYRDNWTVGYTPQVTVAAWVGNFDGSSMDHVSGITGAGPLFHEVMVAAMGSREKLPLAIDSGAPPDALERVEICTLSGARVTPACPTHVFEWFTHDEAASLGFDEMHERVDIDLHGLQRWPRGERHVQARGAGIRASSCRFTRRDCTAANRTLAPDEFSPDCPPDASDTVTGGGSLAIRYPLDDAKFVIDCRSARRYQEVLAVVGHPAPTSTAEVSLLDDGSGSGSPAHLCTLRWPLAPGDHDLVARVGSVESSRTHIHVRN